MDSDSDILNRFQGMKIGRTGDQRAPHKPLLALWAIGRCLRGEQRLAPYALAEREVAALLKRFGPHGRSENVHLPFWHMRNDRVWEVERADLVRSTSSGHAFISDLRQHGIRGGLTEADHDAFQSNPGLALRIAESLIAQHFPPSLREEILDSVSIGLVGPAEGAVKEHDRWVQTRRRRRDRKFRKLILDAYRNRCAVCEFSGHFFGEPLALDAAHIKWHEHRGPAVVENGLALCALHHRLFDRGMFTVLPDLEVKVAHAIHGVGVDGALGQYDSRPLQAIPREVSQRPSPDFLCWHGREVFRNPEICSPPEGK